MRRAKKEKSFRIRKSKHRARLAAQAQEDTLRATPYDGTNLPQRRADWQGGAIKVGASRSAEGAASLDESRFQRSAASLFGSWGVAPRWYDVAPLALWNGRTFNHTPGRVSGKKKQKRA
jgi:hypothetical protein